MSSLPQEIRALRNFSSLNAILVSLQCMAIHHLKKMWGKVSRWIGLSHQISDVGRCYLYVCQCSLTS